MTQNAAYSDIHIKHSCFSWLYIPLFGTQSDTS